MRRRAGRLVRPREWAPLDWSLWDLPRPGVALVLLVQAAAVAAIAGTTPLYSVTGRHLAWFAVLAGLSVLHLEVTRRVERMRELASEGALYVDLKSIWTFAGLLVLPPSLVAALIVITYAHSWFRVGRAILPHRWIFSAATVVLASAVAGAILAAAHPSTYPAIPLGWSGLVVVVAAAVARWAVNSVLVFAAMPVMNVATTWRRAFRAVFGTPTDDLIEFATLCYGALVAVMLTFNPPFVLVLALPLLMMHRGVQFEHAAELDRETGVLRLERWRELALKQLERAERLGAAAGYLFVRLDEIDARLAEATDARIGRLVADAVRAEVRDSGLIGRLPGGYDFAVLVVDAHGDELARVAERIRCAVRAIQIAVDGPAGPRVVGGLTVSIGCVGYPVPAGTLAELFERADNALFQARTFVRDEVRVAGPDDRPLRRNR